MPYCRAAQTSPARARRRPQGSRARARASLGCTPRRSPAEVVTPPQSIHRFRTRFVRFRFVSSLACFTSSTTATPLPVDPSRVHRAVVFRRAAVLILNALDLAPASRWYVVARMYIMRPRCCASAKEPKKKPTPTTRLQAVVPFLFGEQRVAAPRHHVARAKHLTMGQQRCDQGQRRRGAGRLTGDA